MKKFLTSFATEFQTFIARGNVIDLAVAVILGGAFGTVVEGFTAILTGAIGLVFGQPNFAAVTLFGIPFGPFINATVNFLLVALALFFFLKGYNSLRQRLAGSRPRNPRPRKPRHRRWCCSRRFATS